MTLKEQLKSYGITDAIEIIHNPSYEVLFKEETNPDLEGFERGIDDFKIHPGQGVADCRKSC